MAADSQDVLRYRKDLQGEIDSAALYRAMAAHEPDGRVAEVYGRLAAVEEKHIAFWRTKLESAGAHVPEPRPGWRTRILIWLARRFGPSLVLPAAATLESVDRAQYDDQAEARGTKMPAQERSHARVLEELAAGRRPRWDGAAFSRLEGRHGAGGGNALRAAVLGANDGLCSNLSLVMGVAGATSSGHAVLISGLAGLLAGACSMAMGEWLSVQSARELYQREIATEADELAEVPDEEEEELVLIYEAKGLSPEQAQVTAKQLMVDSGKALDTLTREELGIDPKELGGSAWVAAVSSFSVFTLGAIVPVTPLFFASGNMAVTLSAVSSAIALFGLGAATTVFTGRNALFAGTRQMLIGLAAAAITYGLGRLLGVVIGG